MTEHFLVKVQMMDNAGNASAPASALTVSYSDVGGKETKATAVPSTLGFYLCDKFQTDRDMLINIDRVGDPAKAIRITTKINLSKGKNKGDTPKSGQDLRFIWGRPTIMVLRVAGNPNPLRETTLKVDLYEPQEVILCVGFDRDHKSKIRLPGMWGQACLRRIGQLSKKLTPTKNPNYDAAIVSVNPSCVFTVLEFNGLDKSRMHQLLSGVGVATFLPGNGSSTQMPLTAVAMGEKLDFPMKRAFLSARDFYAYLTDAGKKRPSTVMSVEILGHGAMGAPAVENTFRNYEGDNSTRICHDGCPTVTKDWGNPWSNPHGAAIQHMPGHFAGLLYATYWEESTGKLVSKVVSQPWVRAIVRHKPTTGFGRQHQERALNTVKNDIKEQFPEDIDFRSTDFNLHSQKDMEAMRLALHKNCILRVFGCAGGDEAPRYRMFSSVAAYYGNAATPDNELVHISSNSSHTGAQEWRIRRRDAKLTYLSQCRRLYGQAMASALERTCYASIPGATTDHDTTTQIRGQKVEKGLFSALKRIGEDLIPAEYQAHDEAQYGKFVPKPPLTNITLRVLVTGFDPFGKDTRNASTDAANGMSVAGILKTLDVPPWIKLDLQLYKKTNVPTVWTCPGAYPDRKKPPPSGGGRGIVEHIRDMEARKEGPDIVIIVGQDNNMLSAKLTTKSTIRLECYSRNLADASDLDNAKKSLARGTTLFPSEPYYLETSVPRFVWGSVIARYREHGIKCHRPEYVIKEDRIKENDAERNSAGGFVCNESYYQVLRESYYKENNHPASGRWVVLAHVCAYLNPTDALNVTAASLCEDMLWASICHGKVADWNGEEPKLINGRGPRMVAGKLIGKPSG